MAGEHKTRRGCLILVGLLLLMSAGCFTAAYAGRYDIRRAVYDLRHAISGKKTVSDRLSQYGKVSRGRLEPSFERAGVSYPPARLVFVGLKRERRLELYAADEAGELKAIRSWPILKHSGGLGPKLKRGDKKVPEGIYKIDFLNPNSTNHLSMRIDYPNEADRRQASEEGRGNLGGEIYIHGKRTSIGCLAMGDAVAQDLFVLVADTGEERAEVIISPLDFRRKGRRPRSVRQQPEWVQARYKEIEAKLNQLPR